MLCEEKAEEYLAVLEEINLYSYREVDEIYRLLTEDQWAYYESMEITDQREQLLLAAALATLKQTFTSQLLTVGDDE